MVLARLPKGTPERALGHRVTVDFITQIARVAHALDQAIDHADCHVAHIHELHGRDVGACAGSEHLARLLPCDLEARELV